MSSSEPSGSGEISKYPDILTWLGAHPDISQYLSFSLHTAIFHNVQFMRKRKAIHNRSLTDLNNFLSSVEKEYKKEKKKVEELCSQMYSIPSTYYPNKQENFIVRKMAFIEICIHKNQVFVHNIMFTYLQDLIVNIKRLMWVFSSRIIPEDQIAVLSPSFLTILYPTSISHKLIKIDRLFAYNNYLQQLIREFSIPHYISNFSDFFFSSIKSIEPKFDTELSYFPETEDEIFISRALFYPNSPQKHKIDAILRKISKSDSEEFTKSILQLCYDTIPDRTKLNSQQQSIALLLLFRTIFHRFYEKFPSLFYKESDPDQSKIPILSNSVALRYTLPIHLLSIESLIELENNPNLTIRNLFLMDQNFQKAAHTMEDAFFTSNPIDCLYCIQQTLLIIHNGALQNRNAQKLHKISENSQSIHNIHNEKLNPNNSPISKKFNLENILSEQNENDEGYLLCFDDLFSLFFGTFMSSNLPDLFYLLNFVQNYMPKQCLSPSFDYAQADLEALVVHCRTLDPVSLTVPEKTKGSFV